MNENTILFLMPAAVVLKPFPKRTPEYFSHNGENYAVFRGITAIWCEPGRESATFKTGDRHSYLIEVEPGVWAGCGCHSDDDFFKQLLDKHTASRISEFKAECATALVDPVAATAKLQADAAERRERIRVEREAQDAEQAERQARYAQREAERFKAQKARFLAGERIEWNDFERLCREHGVEMHMRTIGSGRKRITEIGTTTLLARGKFTAPGVTIAARALQSALVATQQTVGV